jgi:hypothetical protein
MASNTNIQVANLDFSDIKQNFITYLQSQDTFKDYNFTGSALSTLLDVLAYNTQYNAYYLNMVANEMFLDSALQRSSVVSHAKLLNYVPQSASAPTALINLTFTGVTTTYFTLPQYTNFLSEAVGGVNYNYVTTDSTTVPVYSGVAQFNDIEIRQGTAATYTFTVDSTANPSYTFEIPDSNIDTSTLQVLVQQSSSNNSYQVYNPTNDYLSLGSTDTVYFLQEATDGNYQVYFGDGVLGNQLQDGNLVLITAISTQGSAGGLANNFTLIDNIGAYTSVSVTPFSPASQGKDKETIASIKYQAPKAFAAQGRAVSKNDYITALQQNSLGFPFDAVSVWGGEENIPPLYGQVFIALKPSGAYVLTDTQKQLLLEQVITPISVLTVTPNIVDPDYTYLQISANVIYQQSQTTLTPGTMQSGVQAAIYNYAAQYLNTFNSSFNSYQLLTAINTFDPSIVSSDFSLNLQKKFYPTLNTTTTYNLQFNTELQRGVYGSSLTSSPGIEILNPLITGATLDGVYFEEVPSSTSQVSTVVVVNGGYNYTQIPTVTITGDGTGATAVATVVNQQVQSITVTNPGVGYSSAVATITPATGDTTGRAATATVYLNNQFGGIRTYYNDPLKGKVVVNPNVGTIDYLNGIVTLNGLRPINVDNALGELTITVQPKNNLISSQFNRIITVDPYDNAAVSVSVSTKR